MCFIKTVTSVLIHPRINILNPFQRTIYYLQNDYFENGVDALSNPKYPFLVNVLMSVLEMEKMIEDFDKIC